MSYLVLARKYRPKNFCEVIGQQHITKTLKNSILSGRVAHSFLFTGPRGVGKTTTARILAKSLNCQNSKKAEPCNTCDICRDITNGNSVDILEIDGASNNSVDDIRDLRDKIRYMPTVSRYKIYIIDEVHMLSTAAFNALLKTLEEPPGHAIFIFATTEPHKIPATILSRCQRYDFKRLSIKEITDTLKTLALAEEQKITPQIITLIARAADGSLRDAESIMDQVIAFSDGEVQYDEVLYLLGIVKRDQIFSLWQAVFDRKPEHILSGVAQVLERGYDLHYFTEQLLQYLRDLIIYKTCQDRDSLLDIPQEEMELLKKQSDLVSEEDLQQYFCLLTQCMDQMRGSSQAHIILEMMLVQLAEMKKVASLGKILQRLSALEKVFQEEAVPFPEENVGERRKPPLEKKPPINYQKSMEKGNDLSLKEPSSENPPSAKKASSASTALPSREPSSTKPPLTEPSSPAPPLTEPPSDATPLTKSPSPAPSSISFKQKWIMLKEGIKKEKKTLVPILQKATFDSSADDTISLLFPESPPFYLDTIKQKSNQLLLQKWACQIFGENYRVTCCAQKGLKPNNDVSSQEEANRAPEPPEYIDVIPIDDIINKYPIIKTAMETFSARIIQTRVSFRHKD